MCISWDFLLDSQQVRLAFNQAHTLLWFAMHYPGSQAPGIGHVINSLAFRTSVINSTHFGSGVSGADLPLNPRFD